MVTARYEFGGYIGMVGSKIRYSLDADVEGRDEEGINVEDLLESGETKADAARRGICDGRWNAQRVSGKDKEKDAQTWEHRERVRWKGVEVRKLF
jgi:hypothetical protein